MTGILDNLIDNDDDSYVDNNPNKPFDLTVIDTTCQVLKNITSNHLVSEVIALIKTEILNDEDKKIGLTAGGVSLVSREKLSKYGFPKSSARANCVTVTFEASGGAQMKRNVNGTKTKNTNRVRKFNLQMFPSLKKSAKDDCIYGPMEGVTCAAMPCGCAMAPQTMMNYIKSIFDKHQTA
eukprot:340049_1